jgi:iron complex outermembrane receptor protein
MAPLAAALTAALPAMPQAHETPAEPSHEGGVVVITGVQPTSLPTRLPTTIEGLTAGQIEDSVNAIDSEDALKYLPSLLVRKRYPGDYNHAVLSTRASGTGNSARSLVYADGVLLSNLLGNGAAFTPRWGLVTPEEIERVDVLYGPFSAAYPGNSVGAVVDYVTRMPKAFEAHAKVGAFSQPTGLYGDHAARGGWQSSASLGSREGAWAWWLAASHLDSDGQPLVFATRSPSTTPAGPGDTPAGGAIAAKDRKNADWLLLGSSAQYRTRQDHLKARLAYDFTPTLRAAYTAGLWRNDAQGRAASYLRDAGGAAVDNASSGGINNAVDIGGMRYTLTPADFPRSDEQLEHRMQALSIKRHTHGVFDWELAASMYRYARDQVRAYAPTAAAQPEAGRSTDQHGTGWDTLALKAVWRPAGEGGEHVVDAGLQQDGFRLRQQVWNTDDWRAGDPASPNAAFRGNTRLRSAYAQDTWAFAPRWKAVLGLRAEWWQAWGGLTASSNAGFAHPGRSERHLSPKAAMAYELSNDWVLKASTGKALRMPTVSELYQGGFNNAGTFVNNDPTLKPEASWTTELSAEGDIGRQHLRATLFSEDTHDALYSQTNVTVTPNVTSIQNVDHIRTLGVELSALAHDLPTKGVDLTGSLTYADSRILRNDRFPASVGHWQPRVPRWRATVLATWRPDDRWTASLGVRHSGRQYGTLDGSDPNGRAYQGVSPFLVADLRVRYRLSRQWTASAGIDNLGNERYWNFHPYPQRSYSAELAFDL